MPYQEIQALGFPSSPRKLGQYEKPWACISWYGPCTQLVNSKYSNFSAKYVFETMSLSKNIKTTNTPDINTRLYFERNTIVRKIAILYYANDMDMLPV